MKSAAPGATGIKPPWPPGAASAALSLSSSSSMVRTAEGTIAGGSGKSAVAPGLCILSMCAVCSRELRRR